MLSHILPLSEILLSACKFADITDKLSAKPATLYSFSTFHLNLGFIAL
jgi:hypothetical protein